MKKHYITVFIISLIVFLGSYFYYKELQKDIPLAIAKSNQTNMNVDKIRFIFKLGLLSKIGLNNYLLALRLNDETKVDEAIEFYEAAIGFAYISYTKDDECINYAIPMLEQSIDFIKKNRLDIEQKTLNILIENNYEIYQFVEDREMNIWTEMQKNYVEFNRYHLEKENLYKVFFVVVLFMFSLLIISYISRKFLKKRLTSKIESKDFEIKELYERLFFAADQALSGYWEFNIDDDKLFFSRKWKEFLGYKEDELKNELMTFESLVHPDDLDITMQMMDDFIMLKRKEFNAEFRMQHKDGSYRWVNAVGGLMRTQENKMIFYGFHIDITELKDTQNRLQMLNENLKDRVKEEVAKNIHQEMLLFESRKLAAMGSMIGNIIHQWKQPLNRISIIATKLQIIAEDKAEFSEKTVIDESQKIIDNIQRLSEVTDTFRNFLKEKKELKRVVLQDRIEQSLVISQTILKDKNIELIKDIYSTNAIEITTVANQLTEVIINIINNSIDAIEEKNIDDAWVKVILEIDEQKAIISIEDNAKGIPQDVLPHIFEEYFTTKDTEHGTGLGLYMSYKIVKESLKGELYAKNSQNGAVFFIELPL